MASNSFKVSEETPELEYDFSPFGGTGVIQEPSHAMVNQFRKTLASLLDAAVPEGVDADKPSEDLTLTERLRVMSTMLGRDDSAEQTAIIKALADLTRLPVEEIEALPYRQQRSFMGWIVGTFLVDTSSPVTTG